MPVVEFIDNFPTLLAVANHGTTEAVEQVAENIAEGAAGRSRVDTGQMRDGWEVVQGGRYERIVQNATPWTEFNENGTVYMSAQPMLKPEVEAATPELIELTRRAWYGGA